VQTPPLWLFDELTTAISITPRARRVGDPHLEEVARALVPVREVLQHLLMRHRLDPRPVPDSFVLIHGPVGHESDDVQNGALLDWDAQKVLWIPRTHEMVCCGK
jgi:hypothetical protein